MNNIDKIEAFIESGKNTSGRIGLELEHFVCDRDYRVISYPEMAQCLEKICEILRGKPVREHGEILGISCDNFTFSLEPGCQLEISISPPERSRNDPGDLSAFQGGLRSGLWKQGILASGKGRLPPDRKRGYHRG